MKLSETNSNRYAFGLLLAGGKSTRMGTDKAALRLQGGNGPTLLENGIKLIRTLTRAYAVSCAFGRKYDRYPCVSDTVKDCGPAAGLLAGLEHAQEGGFKHLLSLPCDLPAMQPEPLRKLLQAHLDQPRTPLATLFISPATNKIEMLAGVYSADFLPLLRQGIASGEKSIFKMLPLPSCLILPLPENWLRCFYNCNTPADLEILRQI